MRSLSPAQWGFLQTDFEPVRLAGRLLQEVIVDMKEPDPSLNVSLLLPFKERRAEITIYIISVVDCAGLIMKFNDFLKRK